MEFFLEKTVPLEKSHFFLKTELFLEKMQFFLEKMQFFFLGNHSFSLEKTTCNGEHCEGTLLGCQVLCSFQNSWEFPFPSLFLGVFPCSVWVFLLFTKSQVTSK